MSGLQSAGEETERPSAGEATALLNEAKLALAAPAAVSGASRPAASAAGEGPPGGEARERALERLMERLGTAFKRPDLLEQALTHASYKNENSGLSLAGDNERLEYLGDAVLDLVLSDLLMARFPGDREGALSKKRASLVNEDVLAALARESGLTELLLLGKGERQTGGLNKPRILASALEAIFGALFLDSGFSAAAEAATAAFAGRLDALAGAPDYAADFKTRLQERAQEAFRLTPFYRVERERGPDHDKLFDVSVRLGERALAVGQGRNKKAAEQEAARLALGKLEEEKKKELGHDHAK
jgi:ribonuclease-3